MSQGGFEAGDWSAYRAAHVADRVVDPPDTPRGVVFCPRKEGEIANHRCREMNREDGCGDGCPNKYVYGGDGPFVSSAPKKAPAATVRTRAKGKKMQKMRLVPDIAEAVSAPVVRAPSQAVDALVREVLDCTSAGDLVDGFSATGTARRLVLVAEIAKLAGWCKSLREEGVSLPDEEKRLMALVGVLRRVAEGRARR